MRKGILVVPIILLCLTDCTFWKLVHSAKLKNPAFSYVSCDLKDVSARQANVGFVLSAYNPNEIGLKNVMVSYELFTEDKRFLKGDSVRVALPPKDSTRIIVPAEIVYKDIFRIIGPVSEKILLNKKSIPVRIDAVIFGNPEAYSKTESGSLFYFKIKVSRTVDVPLYSLEKKLQNSVGEALKKVLKIH